MTSQNDGVILFRNTMRITTGRLEPFKQAIANAVNFAEENGPQLMVEVFIDEQQMLAHSFQLYRDSESVLAHWQMSDPYIREVMEHCVVAQFDVFGNPSDVVREGIAQGTGEVEVTMTPRFVGGFTRFAS